MGFKNEETRTESPRDTKMESLVLVTIGETAAFSFGASSSEDVSKEIMVVPNSGSFS